MPPIQQIYWHTTVQMPNDSDPTPLPETVDVAVIGGGYTGLSAARTLAKQGVSVAVLEANTIGWGASSRNGGMVLTGLFDGYSKAEVARFASHYPRGEVATPEDIAQVVAFFAAPQTQFNTDQTLIVDGGRSVGVAPT